MPCDPQTCYPINERISIKAESEVPGNIITQSIRETCAKCPERGRKTAREIEEALKKPRPN